MPQIRKSGEFLKTNPTAIRYMRIVKEDCIDEVINFTQQFFNIALDIYMKAVPVKDAQRRREMDAFRLERNKYIFEADHSGQFLVEAYGRQKAELFSTI